MHGRSSSNVSVVVGIGIGNREDSMCVMDGVYMPESTASASVTH